MFNKNLENKFIFIFWWFVFIFLLPWDQEKIVVVNLIVFCYLLYYMVSGSIEENFNQRKNLIRSNLTNSIVTSKDLFSRSCLEVKKYIESFNKIFFSIVNFFINSFLNKTFVNNIFKSNATFYYLNTLLNNVVFNVLKEDFTKNLIAVQSISSSTAFLKNSSNN